MDHCNSTLVETPACALEPLQPVLHAAVRLVADLWPRDHVTGHIKELHRHLSIPPTVSIVHTYARSYLGQRLSYFRDLFVPVSDLLGLTHLRSAASGLNNVSFTRTQFGRRAFSVAAPSNLNSLQVDLRLVADLRRFKRSLKTQLFIKADLRLIADVRNFKRSKHMARQL